MSRQYCRYCGELTTGNGIYCHAHNRCYSESYTKKPNNCKDFVFNPIDAYDLESEYKPREPKETVSSEYEQITLKEFI